MKRRRQSQTEERSKLIARYLITTKCTVRQVARRMGVSKSTAYVDLSVRLARADPLLYAECRKILEFNKSVRHLRGGQATAKKFKKTM